MAAYKYTIRVSNNHSFHGIISNEGTIVFEFKQKSTLHNLLNNRFVHGVDNLTTIKHYLVYLGVMTADDTISQGEIC